VNWASIIKTMGNNKTLNILGCVPSLLNILLELTNETTGIENFRIFNNMPIDNLNYLNPLNGIKVDFVEFNKVNKTPNPEGIFALSVVGPKSKEIVHSHFKKLFHIENKQFINLIHPTSYVSRSVQLTYGLQLEPLSTIASCTSIGFGVNIKRNCNIGHHCELDDFVTINPGVTLSSFVKIGKKTMIGSGTSVKENITIGENSVIGVGSVVVKDIPNNCIAFGNPCVVKRMNSKKVDNNK